MTSQERDILADGWMHVCIYGKMEAWVDEWESFQNVIFAQVPIDMGLGRVNRGFLWCNITETSAQILEETKISTNDNYCTGSFLAFFHVLAT